jgi:5-methylcytosine-specific restriction endonuclease McrA
MKVIGLLIVIGIFAGNTRLFFKVFNLIAQAAFNLLNTVNAKVVISGVGVIVLLFILRKIWILIANIRQRRKRQKAIATLTPSADRDDYIIDRDDYRRGSPKESYYRKTFCLYLLDSFGNCCARCGSKENGMDIDHFIFSKNEGGCFIMRHRDGYLINNAIPLCQSCNRSKSDNDYKSFFIESELLAILERNVLMTRRLNAKSIFDESGKIAKQKRAA